jgi:hypothetical protein
MANILIGFVCGFLFAFLVRLIVINVREKSGKDEIKYRPMPLGFKMKSMIREVVFKFSIRRFNRDFLLNVKLHGKVVMQVMHRSHFPELLKNLSDVRFGLAIYIPIKPLSAEQQQILVKVLNEEMEQFSVSEYPIEYFVVDAGVRAKFNGYLMARIIKDVFDADDVDLELYDEGILPYHYALYASDRKII